MSSKKTRIRSQDSVSSNWSNGSNDKESKLSDKYDEKVVNSEHELFLQAFEKPTQIYRFLRTRQLVSPIFLNRSLTYMRHRLSRIHNKKRKDFSVDSLLKYVTEKKQKEAEDEESSGNLTLNFLCIKNQSSNSEYLTCNLETTLLKMCQQKRKEVTQPIMQFSVGKCEFKVNSEDNETNCLTIYKNEFSESNGHLVKQCSYSLQFVASFSKKSTDLVNGNSVESDNKINDKCLISEDGLRAEPSNSKRRRIENESELEYYKAELIIYDKHQRCLLTDGEYTVVLQSCSPPKSNKFGRHNKFASWEALDPEDCDNLTIDETKKQFGSMDVFRKGPVLRFQLSWSCLNSQNHINGLNPCLTNKLDLFSNNENNSSIVNNINDNSSLVCHNIVISSKTLSTDQLKHCNNNMNKNMNAKKSMRVIYQFLFNNNTRQQTKPQNDYHCPWCSLNCKQLYSLIKHLKLCHSRFLFSYVPDVKCARIDVSINECYDGSYAGNPHDLSYSNTGFAFSRNGPVRRNPVTHVIVCRPKRFPHSLSEFDEPDDEDGPNGRTYVSGHNRLYYHTTSCLPIRPQEMDYDSEAENDPQWMKDKTQMMIDEFTDVNEGEKEVMKMWNLHIMKNGFVGDCQIPLSCHMFIEEKGFEIIEKKLYKNFVLHLCNLFDFGLLNASAFAEVIKDFDEKRKLYQQKQPLNELIVKSDENLSSTLNHF